MRAAMDDMLEGIVVDLFAGGGGASLGIERALGRPVTLAVNHSPQAVAMHRANHPLTRHHCEDVWQVSPRQAVRGRPEETQAPEGAERHCRYRFGLQAEAEIQALATSQTQTSETGERAWLIFCQSSVSGRAFKVPRWL